MGETDLNGKQTAEELVYAAAESIKPVDESFRGICREHWNSLCKPVGGFGALEEMISRIGAIQRTEHPKISKAAVVIMGADNGVAAEGVSQCGSEVTRQVLRNMAEKKSSVCIMSKFRQADVIPVDIGMNEPAFSPGEEIKGDGVLERPVRRGTGDIAKGPAMSREEAVSAIRTGIDLAWLLKEKGYQILVPGEMGIGNTTTSTTCLCALFGLDPAEVTGPGAGLSGEGVRHKTAVIRRALEVNFPGGKGSSDIPDILSKVGGLDIAGMTGLFLGAASSGMPAVVDGFITALSAYMATCMSGHAREYMIQSHGSSEPGGRILMEALGFDPYLHLGMHLGEGTGAALMLPLLDEALYVYENLPSFGDSGIEAYKPLV